MIRKQVQNQNRHLKEMMALLNELQQTVFRLRQQDLRFDTEAEKNNLRAGL
jgi:hypothetical protein